MFAFLKKLFSAEARAAAFETERDFWKAQAANAFAEKARIEARFLREVTGNRKREDEMAQMIREMAGVKAKVSKREELTEAAPPAEAEQPELFKIDNFVVDEAAIEMRAQEFSDARAVPYTDAEFKQACDTIRANPDKYF